MRPCFFALAALLMVAAIPAFAQSQPPINPYPRPAFGQPQMQRWDFNDATDGWGHGHNCSLSASPDALLVESAGQDPYFFSPALNSLSGPTTVRIRLRCQNTGHGAFYWTTDRSPNWDEVKSAPFPLRHDGQFHQYQLTLPVDGSLTRLRIDPGTGPGQAALDWIELAAAPLHPLEIVALAVAGPNVTASVCNHASESLDVSSPSQTHTIAPDATAEFTFTAPAQSIFESFTVLLTTPALAPIARTTTLYHPDLDADWLTLRSGALEVQFAPNGIGARLLQNGQTVAILAPLAAHDDQPIPLTPQRTSDTTLECTAPGLKLAFRLDADQLHFNFHADEPAQGPVLRALGHLQAGLLPGLEYLGPGEQSSSTLDIHTPDHLRFAPDPAHVTIPFFAAVTDRAALALAWDDTSLQPLYASPNFFEGTPDHRMAIVGSAFSATILARQATLDDLILWAVTRRPLPGIPPAPRSPQAQNDLCLAAILGPCSGPEGWGHCAQSNWTRHPYADFASTLFRLQGRLPDLPNLVPGGAHVPNHAAWFLSGRAQEFLGQKTAHAQNLLNQQQHDGAFLYDGKYLEGHFENTSSGHCGKAAADLLDFAFLTGRPDALAAGLKTLQYCKRFPVPRGAQTWELSLHTPDILAAAHLTRAATRAFQLTNDPQYLAQARTWALRGLPFVYLASDYPAQPYAGIAVFGATNFQAPLWIGRPVQWCALVYAYSLNLLAPYDATLDWNHIAAGILRSAQLQQYPDGPVVGTLPDSFDFVSGTRFPPDINPCALVSLALRLDGRLDSLAVAAVNNHRIVSPFPIEASDNHVVITAPKDLTYQILIDGREIRSITSTGRDTIPLP